VSYSIHFYVDDSRGLWAMAAVAHFRSIRTDRPKQAIQLGPNLTTSAKLQSMEAMRRPPKGVPAGD